MVGKFFQVHQSSKKSKARIGEIHTDHGIIQTPAFVPVATKGTLKSILPSLLTELKTQVAFVNTYHLVTHPGADIIERAGGIHKYSMLNIPLMSDSGGFQVFSLAQSQKSPLRPARRDFAGQAIIRTDEYPLVVKISEDGVKFRSIFDGTLLEFTPEKSMEYQRKIGADLNMAFDECTYYPATHEYAEKAMVRTHEWLKRCITEKRRWGVGIDARKVNRNEKMGKTQISINQFPNQLQNPCPNTQFLYGIIHGGTFKELRIKSAKFVVKQDISGVAIGGVSVGETKAEMREQVAWVSPFLPKDKPVHLLGVGQIDDIIDLVGYGIDTFDCVEPTRIARMGSVYQTSNIQYPTTNNFQIDILKGKYKADMSPVDESCNCYVCSNFTKSYLHHLFKQRELLGYTLASYHNLSVMERLFDTIRQGIEENKI